MNCPCGGLIIQHHNELRDLTAFLLAEFCHDVTTEPVLQHLTGETMQYQTAITTDDARLDIQASGFWGVKSERTFFDVKVFTPLAKSYNDKPLSSVFSQLERHKRRSYNQ